MKKMYFLLMCTCFIIFAVTGCSGKNPSDKGERFPVGVAEVTRGGVFTILSYVGDIKAQEQIMVYPKAPGKLSENTVKEQDAVKKGDIIAYIDRDEIGFEFEKVPVDSPIDGIVGRVYLDKGESVSPSTAVAQIVNMDIVKVKIDVAERELPKLKESQSAKIKIDAYPDESFEGKVERVSPVVDLVSRTAPAEIQIPNADHKLKPGMFARIEIIAEEKENVLTIPRDAILKEDSSYYVFTVGADNRARHRKVEIGLHENNKFEVTVGLDESELVVTMGNNLLKEGDSVEIVE